MNKIRCIIVDDEKIAREGVTMLLSKDNNFELLDTCANGKQAIESIVHYEPDLVFLDIQMPDINGFEVLKALSSRLRPMIVFITAYDQYAIKAFEACAFDYLLKPFDDERFFDVLKRTKNQISLIKSGKYSQNIEDLVKQFTKPVEKNEEPVEEFTNRLLVKREGGVTFIDVNDIISIEASDYYFKIITNIDEHIMRKSLNSIEEKLNRDQFVRIHRSTIVNIDYIRSVERYTPDEHIVVMKNDKRYRISKSGRKILKNRFLI